MRFLKGAGGGTLVVALASAGCVSILGDFESGSGGFDAGAFPDGTVDNGDAQAGPDAPLPDGDPEASSEAGEDGGPDADANVLGPALTLPQKAVDFGLSDCGGSTATTKDLTLVNTGSAPLTYSAILGSTAQFTLGMPTNGTIAPGGRTKLAVTAQPVPSATVAGTHISATITIVTNDPARPMVQVPVSVDASGGTIAITPSKADFGQIPAGSAPPDLPIDIANTGNADVLVSFSPVATPQNELSFHWTGTPAGVALKAKSSVPGAGARFRPVNGSTFALQVGLSVVGPVCGPPPPALQIRGAGTLGQVSVSPGLLDFGPVDCGGVGAAQSVTIKNTGNADVHITSATLTKGAAYYVIPLLGTQAVAPGGTYSILVTPKAIPNAAASVNFDWSGTLTIRTDAPGDVPHNIDLREHTHGSTFTVSPASLAFGSSVPLGRTSSANATFSLSGDVPLAISLSEPTGAYSTSSPRFALQGTQALNVTYTPSHAVDQSSTLAISASGGPICGPVPTTISLQGGGLCPPVTRPVFINKTAAVDAVEVTAAQYLCFLDNSKGAVLPSIPYCKGAGGAPPRANWPPTGDQMSLPVRSIDWCDAATYCAKYGKHLCGAPGGGPVAKYGDVSPQGSLWSYACANGVNANGAPNTQWPYGNQFSPTVCNVSESGFGQLSPGGPAGKFPGCTGFTPPYNQVFDMVGNVDEWEDNCQNTAGTTGATDACLSRGGTLSTTNGYANCYQPRNPPLLRSETRDYVGFRCCQ